MGDAERVALAAFVTVLMLVLAFGLPWAGRGGSTADAELRRLRRAVDREAELAASAAAGYQPDPGDIGPEWRTRPPVCGTAAMADAARVGVRPAPPPAPLDSRDPGRQIQDGGRRTPYRRRT